MSENCVICGLSLDDHWLASCPDVAIDGEPMHSADVELETRTWDGEPLWSPSTVAESLFDRSAFEQMPGQTSLETDAPTPFKVGGFVLLPDADVNAWHRVEVRRVFNDGAILEVRNPYALQGDTEATLRVKAETVRHAE